MEAGLPLTVLLAPLVLALMAVALMNLFSRPTEPGEGGALPTSDAPREGAVPTAALVSHEPDGRPEVTLTPARYVGGHPARGAPTAAPLVALHRNGLWVARAARREPPFGITWAAVEQIVTLDAGQMRFAAGSVRGMAADAIPEDGGDATYLRIRHLDERGWWQHTVFELDPAHAAAQAEAIIAAWRAHRPDAPASNDAENAPPA